MESDMVVVTKDGVERPLNGWKPTPAAVIARMYDEKSLIFSTDEPSLLAAPRELWVENSCDLFWKHRKNQSSTSMCVGASAAHAYSTAAAKAGFDVDVSPAAIYAPICGGMDQGASVGEALEALQNYGAFVSGFNGLSDFDWRSAYRTKFWQHPDSEEGAAAAENTILEAVFCGDDLDAFLLGLQRGGWSGQFAMGADRYFETDEHGSLPKCRGTRLNHALFATGGSRKHPVTGVLELEGGNSWGSTFGLNGLFYFDPFDWLPHSGQELWLCRSTSIPKGA